MLDQGKNITFVLNATNEPIQNWTVFCNFYSINRIFPQAKIVIIADNKCDHQLFNWTKKLKGKVVYKKVTLSRSEKLKYCLENKLAEFPIVYLEPNVVLASYFDCDFLRTKDKFFCGDENVWFANDLVEFSEKKISVLSNSEESGNFVDLKGNVGNFIYERWINSKECPFSRTARIQANKVLCENENKVLNIWKDCNNLFYAIN
jgi:hypothetical protein